MVVSLIRILDATNVLSTIIVMFNWRHDFIDHIYNLDAMIILRLFIYLLKRSFIDKNINIKLYG